MEARVAAMEDKMEQTYTALHAEGGFDEGTSFKRYHYQALKPISEEALLAGFLMICLKKCVIPMHHQEVVLPIVALPAMQLVALYRVALLPAIMANLQYGLYQLVA